MQKNETLQLKCCLKQWAVCCWSFLSRVSLPWPPPAHHLGGWRWPGSLILAGWQAHLHFCLNPFPICVSKPQLAGRDMLSVSSLSPSLCLTPRCCTHVGSCWISNSQSGGTGYLCASICCAPFLILFWTPHWGRNKSSRWQVGGGTARKTMKSSRAIPVGTVVFVTPDVMYSCSPSRGNYRIWFHEMDLFQVSLCIQK